MEEKSECIFCKIASGEVKGDKFLETDNFFVVKDKFPISDGHALIISKKHFDNLLHFPNLLGNELISLIKEVYVILSKEVFSEGFNVVQNNFKAAGQAINHFHVHVVPRKLNDGVRLK